MSGERPELAGTQPALPSEDLPAPTVDLAGPDADASLALIRFPPYQLLERLGRGGMGQVFRAFDPRLERHVALKVLFTGQARVLDEARAQARVDHPHVCKVYEVGDEQRPFIAMHFVDGRTVGEAAGDMSIEERVRVMVDVADAVHGAHREGLIHRDIKPKNIMVERRDDGRWHAWVMDFGLARIAGAGDGRPAGTPAYMAPEQLRGAPVLDRRSDVYGLGATLYELLTGKPPQGGRSVTEVLVSAAAAPSPRAVAHGISADLEAIVLRCLALEPARRYDSARALAEDLRRWLDGEPVAARPRSLGARALHRLRRHKAIVAIALVVVAAAAALAVTTARERARASRDAALARRFGERVMEIEGIMRMARLLPVHDIRREKAQARELMATIEAELSGAASWARGAGLYALGRGHMSLGEIGAAEERLRAAWEAGYQLPETAQALGLVLGERYHQELSRLSGIEDEAARLAEERRLERDLRDPALDWLRRGQGGAYPQALIAFHEGKHWDALELAHRAATERPDDAAPRTLQAAIHLRQADAAIAVDDNHAAAAALQAAAAPLAEALDISRSDAGLRALACRRAGALITIHSARGGPAQQSFAEAVAACALARRIDADAAEPLYQEALVRAAWSKHQREIGQDPEPEIRRAIALGEQALAIAPDDRDALVVLGDAHRVAAIVVAEKGGDPGAEVARALLRYDRLRQLDVRSVNAIAGGAAAHEVLAEHQLAAGRDPRPTLALVIAANRELLALHPDAARAFVHLGNAHDIAAEYEIGHDLDAAPSLAAAAEAYERVISLRPDYYIGHSNAGNAYQRRALWERAHGRDAMVWFDRAVDSYRRAVELRPDGAIANENLGGAHLNRGAHRFWTGGDPSADLAEARRVIGHALEIDRDSAWAWTWMGQIELTCAYQVARAGRDPRAELAAADEALRRAIALHGKFASPRELLAELWLLRAERGEPGALAAAERAAAAALAVHAQAARALAVRGAVALRRGQAAGAADVDRALTLSPALRPRYAAYAAPAAGASAPAPR